VPKKFNFFESAIRGLLKDYIQRGKVDVFVTYEDYTEEKVSLKYNSSLAAEYMDNFKKMAEQFGIDNDVKVSMLARCPEVLSMEQVPEDEDQMWALLSEALKHAAENFVETRVREGEHLKNDLISKLDNMLSLVDFIETRSPKVLEEYRKKLEDKVKDMLQNTTIDESRILTEVTIFADKICVDEETVRLRSHIEGMKKELLKGGSVGRKLDFIAQEMNRESNTILSKSNDMEISDQAIILKTEIEKVREQIQNIE
ncbi:MAG: YicC family protein, partial [Lachnospiraceae bacterium]|nr:YicC family protein [Lachnospiraceae bacterium]